MGELRGDEEVVARDFQRRHRLSERRADLSRHGGSWVSQAAPPPGTNLARGQPAYVRRPRGTTHLLLIAVHLSAVEVAVPLLERSP